MWDFFKDYDNIHKQDNKEEPSNKEEPTRDNSEIIDKINNLETKILNLLEEKENNNDN